MIQIYKIQIAVFNGLFAAGIFSVVSPLATLSIHPMVTMSVKDALHN